MVEIGPMTDAIAHRGPDGQGFYLGGMNPLLVDDAGKLPQCESPVAFGHRRLAILDPTGGAQPVVSEDGQVAALLNGEIYNFEAIRDRFLAAGVEFKSDCDAEILIHLYRESLDQPGSWLRELDGIFALAIWDNQRERLLLARDHFGVKPLHYAEHDERFLFGSEIKSLLTAGLPARMNDASFHAMLNVRFIPGNQTLFNGILRLPAAHYLWVERGIPRCPERYYSLPEESEDRSRSEWCDMILDGFNGAVSRQMLSDVKMGIGLSGGLDSSMIVAAYDQRAKNPASLRVVDRVLRTFSLGFNQPDDENEEARSVAEMYGTEHHDLRIDVNPVDKMREIIRFAEEPKLNVIQVHTLAGFAAQEVKVFFSGLGGDELFAGYDVHRFANTLGRFHNVPGFLQNLFLQPASSLLWKLQTHGPVRKWDHFRIGAQIAMSVGDRSMFYCRLRNAWDGDAAAYDRIYANPERFRAAPKTQSWFESYFDGRGNYLDQMLRAEFHEKMVNDLLICEDRMTSAHGLEGRVPFLDRKLVELAFRIPAAEKMRGQETKALWKDSVGSLLPESIVHKRKQGFSFNPFHQWQKDLRTVVERDLSREWCEDTGLFNYEFIRTVLDYPPHRNLRWHYFLVWLMLGTRYWMENFDVRAGGS